MSTTATNINTERLKKLLADLVNIYSPSGKEHEVAGYVESYLSTNGLPVELQEVETETGRKNVIFIPRHKIPQVVFIGHIDTVEAYDYENYEAYIENDEMFGLGTADMKAGCAAMIEAFVSFTEKHGDQVPAALAFLVGEEELGDGAEALLADYHFAWAIIGEPTGMIPCLSHHGYVETKLVTSGKRMHPSVIEVRHNAINAMLVLLLELTAYLDSKKSEVIYNLRDMNSTRVGFFVSDRCEAWIDLHLPPEYPVGRFITEIEEIVNKNKPSSSTLENILSFTTIHSGFSLPDKGLLPDILEEVYKARSIDYKPGSFPSDSDASILWTGGIKPVILGPGELYKAHSEDESIRLDEVILAADVYFDILVKLAELDKKPAE